MKTRLLSLVSLTLLIIFQSIGQTNISKIPTDWLSGDQPKLLSMMANSPSSREGLKGSSMNLTAIAGGWHAQAIGQYKEFIYIAFSDGSKGKGDLTLGEKNPAGQLWIYNTTTNESRLIEMEKGYAHPCSIQIVGQYLSLTSEAEYGVKQGLGVSRESRSIVQIFDLSKDPYCSVEVSRIDQPTVNSGGAGLTFSSTEKRWYMLVDQDGKDRVALYKTTSEKIDSWSEEPIAYYQRFGTGAGLNLISASDNSIWGLYFDNEVFEDSNLSNYDIVYDYVKMFKLIDSNGKPVETREIYTQRVNISSPRVKGVGELLADRPSMRFGATLRNENGKQEVLVCQRNMNNTFNIDRITLTEGNRTNVMFANLAKAKGEIYLKSSTKPSENVQLKKNQSESESVIMSSPITGDMNFLSEKSVSTSKLGSLKSLKSAVQWIDALEKQTSAPLAFFYLEGLTDIKGQMKEYFTSKNTDKKK